MAVNTIKMKASKRAQLGSRAMKRLRDQGLLPAVIYGHKQDVLPIVVNTKEMTNHINHGAHVIEFDIEGTTETVLVKETQYDFLGAHLIHVDFSRVSLDETVEVTVPLELRGTPKGEADGGKLQQMMAEIQIECRVLEIPEIIRHNVSEMKLDDILHIRELQLPAGLKCLQDGDLIVAMVREVKEEVAEAAEGTTAEPEVIGQKERDEQEEAEKAEKK